MLQGFSNETHEFYRSHFFYRVLYIYQLIYSSQLSMKISLKENNKHFLFLFLKVLFEVPNTSLIITWKACLLIFRYTFPINISILKHNNRYRIRWLINRLHFIERRENVHKSHLSVAIFFTFYMWTQRTENAFFQPRFFTFSRLLVFSFRVDEVDAV